MDNLFSVNTIIIIFAILFPGIIIRRAFYSDKFSKQFYRGQFSERLITTLFWGVINALIGLFLTFGLLKIFYLDECLSCVIQNKIWNFYEFDITKQSVLVGDFSYKYLIFVFLFFFNLFLLPSLLGRLAFVTIRRLRLDLRFAPLSFSNHWHYFFRGEMLARNSQYAENQNFDSRKSKDYIPVVDILTVEGEQKYIYKGILVDYNLKDQNEELDSLILTLPLKKMYDKDSYNGQEANYIDFQPIPGNLILIPFSTVVNINISFKNYLQDAHEPKSVQPSTHQSSEEAAKLNNENTTAGCIMMIAIIIFVSLAAQYADGISYWRFLGGVIYVFMGSTLFTTLFFYNSKERSLKSNVFMIFTVLLFIAVFLWIFKIWFFN